MKTAMQNASKSKRVDDHLGVARHGEDDLAEPIATLYEGQRRSAPDVPMQDANLKIAPQFDAARDPTRGNKKNVGLHAEGVIWTTG